VTGARPPGRFAVDTLLDPYSGSLHHNPPRRGDRRFPGPPGLHRIASSDDATDQDRRQGSVERRPFAARDRTAVQKAQNWAWTRQTRRSCCARMAKVAAAIRRRNTSRCPPEMLVVGPARPHLGQKRARFTTPEPHPTHSGIGASKPGNYPADDLWLQVAVSPNVPRQMAPVNGQPMAATSGASTVAECDGLVRGRHGQPAAVQWRWARSDPGSGRHQGLVRETKKGPGHLSASGSSLRGRDSPPPLPHRTVNRVPHAAGASTLDAPEYCRNGPNGPENVAVLRLRRPSDLHGSSPWGRPADAWGGGAAGLAAGPRGEMGSPRLLPTCARMCGLAMAPTGLVIVGNARCCPAAIYLRVVRWA